MRKNLLKNNINSSNTCTNSKQKILDNLILKELLKTGLFDKDIIVSKIDLNQINNVTYINLDIFYRTSKIIKYRRLNRNLRQKFNVDKNKTLCTLTKLFNNTYNNNLLNPSNVVINIRNLNALIKKDNLNDFFYIFKRFNTSLFSRGYNLFLDFTKITSLLNDKHISIETYLLILGQIFKNLNKKKHSTYIQFVKTICTVLIGKRLIKGIKFSISGRILGKTRASCVKIQKGALALNTIDSNNKFAKAHVYTIYGAYGIKLWIAYNN